MAKNDCRVYNAAYKNIVMKKIPVTGYKYDTEVSEIIENIDDFRQCYKKGDKIREQLPRYWFVSKEGFLINLQNKKNPKWIKPSLKPDRPEFKISKYKKPIATYTLVALVWDSLRTYNAQSIMDDRGIHCIGKLKKIDNLHVAKIQTHHTNGYLKEKTLENYIANNNPKHLQIITVKEHDILNKLRAGKKSTEIFYQPLFVNVPDEGVKIFDIERGIMLNPKTLNVTKILSIDFLPDEQHCLMTDDYVFFLENGRQFLESTKTILIDIAKTHPELCMIPYGIDGHERIIFYFPRRKQ